MKGNSKRTSGNPLSPLGAQNKDISTASQTLLTEVKITHATQAILKRLGFRTIFPIIFLKSNPVNRVPEGTTESVKKTNLEQNLETKKHKRH